MSGVYIKYAYWLYGSGIDPLYEPLTSPVPIYCSAIFWLLSPDRNRISSLDPDNGSVVRSDLNLKDIELGTLFWEFHKEFNSHGIPI